MFGFLKRSRKSSPDSNKCGPRRFRPGFEQLEDRQLLSASAVSNLGNVLVQFNLLPNGHLQQTIGKIQSDLGVVQGLYQGQDNTGHQVAYEWVNTYLKEYTPNQGWVANGAADDVVQDSNGGLLFAHGSTLYRATGVPGGEVALPGNVQTLYQGGKVIEQDTWNAAAHTLAKVTCSARATVETDYAKGKATEQKTWNAAGSFVKDVIWSATATVQTDYTNGKAYQQQTWDGAGNYIKLVTWSVTATVETDYAKGKAVEQKTWNAAGSFVKDVTWSATATVQIDYNNGKAYQQQTWDVAGHYLQLITWNAAGKVQTDYRNGKAYLQQTWDSAGNHVKDVTWSATATVETDYAKGKTTQEKTWDAAGNFIAVRLYLDRYDPQGNDPNGCGPNSGARVMRYYGYAADMASLKSRFSAMDPVLSGIHLGAPGPDLAKIMRDAGYRAATYEQASFDRVLSLLAAGHPVVAMIRVGSVDLGLEQSLGDSGVGGEVGKVLNGIGSVVGHAADVVMRKVAFPQLHWVALDGYDAAKQVIYYTDTDGTRVPLTYAAFQAQWNWTTGNALAARVLQANGVVPQSIVY